MRNFAVDFGREILKLIRKRDYCCPLLTKSGKFQNLKKGESEFSLLVSIFYDNSYNIPTWSIISLLFFRWYPEPVSGRIRNNSPRFFIDIHKLLKYNIMTYMFQVTVKNRYRADGIN